MNQATAFIDGSMIYGTTHLEGNVRLRVKQNGYLRSRLFSDGRWLLPISLDPLDGCNRPDYINKSRYCFKSGQYLVLKKKHEFLFVFKKILILFVFKKFLFKKIFIFIHNFFLR